MVCELSIKKILINFFCGYKHWKHGFKCPNIMRKKGVLQLALQLNFWNVLDTYNSSYIWCNSLELNYNFVTTTPFELLCNSPMIKITMSCWHHFSSIYQSLTNGTMKTFHDFFEILICIIHYDYLFNMVLDYDTWHNQKLPCGNWLNFGNKKIYIPR